MAYLRKILLCALLLPLVSLYSFEVSQLRFGNIDSPVEVYIFTDWLCPVCQRMEPTLDKALPKVLAQSRVIFALLPIHQGSLNFAGFDISMMLHNKADYVKIRPILNKIATTMHAATTEHIAAELSRQKIAYQPVDDATVREALQYFRKLSEQYAIQGTPTIVFQNNAIHKQKKLVGLGEVTEENILKTLQDLQKNE